MMFMCLILFFCRKLEDCNVRPFQKEEILHRSKLFLWVMSSSSLLFDVQTKAGSNKSFTLTAVTSGLSIIGHRFSFVTWIMHWLNSSFISTLTKKHFKSHWSFINQYDFHTNLLMWIQFNSKCICIEHLKTTELNKELHNLWSQSSVHEAGNWGVTVWLCFKKRLTYLSSGTGTMTDNLWWLSNQFDGSVGYNSGAEADG